MIFQDNVLKAYLKNVYFITGTPCGGKTTVSRALAKRYGLTVYDIDEQFDLHQKISDPALQPAMNQRFANADAFFGRTVEDYEQWLTDNTREQLDFVLLDLIRLSQDRLDACMCILDKRTCVSVEVDGFLRIEEHGLAWIHLKDEILQGTEADHPEEGILLLLGEVVNLAQFQGGLLSCIVHVRNEVVSIYDCSFA